MRREGRTGENEYERKIGKPRKTTEEKRRRKEENRTETEKPMKMKEEENHEGKGGM